MKQSLPLEKKVTSGETIQGIYYKGYLKKNALTTVQSNEVSLSITVEVKERISDDNDLFYFCRKSIPSTRVSANYWYQYVVHVRV